MKMIFYRYKSICEPDYIEAFKKLGLDVVEDNQGMQQELTVADKMSELGNLIIEHSPLFVFSINFFPFISMICNRINVRYIALSVDCPVLEVFNETVKGEFNRLFLFDKSQYMSVSPYNPQHVFHMPLGAPTERVSELLGDTHGYLYDISFVGSLYKEKDPFLLLSLDDKDKERFINYMKEQIQSSVSGLSKVEERLTQEDVEMIKNAAEAFYPSDLSVTNLDRYVAINDYISPHITYIERTRLFNGLGEAFPGKLHLFTQSDVKELSKEVVTHSGVNSLSEMPFVFRQSKININTTMRSIQTGLPQRIWDVLACRGFLITGRQEELQELFTIGEHLEAYSDTEELKEKIRYYLSHDDEREKIAAAGYRYVCENGTVLQRVLTMMRHIE